MQVNSRSAAWTQGIVLVVVLGAIAGALLERKHKPFDQDTLDIQVQALQSHAAEAGLLVQQARADQLAPGFVGEHAGQLAENVQRVQDKLDAKPAEPRYATTQAGARRLGAALHDGLQALSLDGRAARVRGFGFDAIGQRLAALHQQLKPGE